MYNIRINPLRGFTQFLHQFSWQEVGDRAKAAVRDNYLLIIEKLQCKEVIRILNQDGVLSSEQCEKLKKKLELPFHSNKEVAEDLLEVIKRKDKWWIHLTRACRASGDHKIAKIIESALPDSEKEKIANRSGKRKSKDKRQLRSAAPRPPSAESSTDEEFGQPTTVYSRTGSRKIPTNLRNSPEEYSQTIPVPVPSHTNHASAREANPEHALTNQSSHIGHVSVSHASDTQFYPVNSYGEYLPTNHVQLPIHRDHTLPNQIAPVPAGHAGTRPVAASPHYKECSSANQITDSSASNARQSFQRFPIPPFQEYSQDRQNLNPQVPPLPEAYVSRMQLPQNMHTADSCLLKGPNSIHHLHREQATSLPQQPHPQQNGGLRPLSGPWMPSMNGYTLSPHNANYPMTSDGESVDLQQHNNTPTDKGPQFIPDFSQGPSKSFTVSPGAVEENNDESLFPKITPCSSQQDNDSSLKASWLGRQPETDCSRPPLSLETHIDHVPVKVIRLFEPMGNDGSWSDFAGHLTDNILFEDLEKIEVLPFDRKVGQVLQMFRQREGSQATFGRIIDALKKIKRKDILHKIEELTGLQLISKEDTDTDDDYDLPCPSVCPSDIKGDKQKVHPGPVVQCVTETKDHFPNKDNINVKQTKEDKSKLIEIQAASLAELDKAVLSEEITENRSEGPDSSTSDENNSSLKENIRNTDSSVSTQVVYPPPDINYPPIKVPLKGQGTIDSNSKSAVDQTASKVPHFNMSLSESSFGIGETDPGSAGMSSGNSDGQEYFTANSQMQGGCSSNDEQTVPKILLDCNDGTSTSGASDAAMKKHPVSEETCPMKLEDEIASGYFQGAAEKTVKEYLDSQQTVPKKLEDEMAVGYLQGAHVAAVRNHLDSQETVPKELEWKPEAPQGVPPGTESEPREASSMQVDFTLGSSILQAEPTRKDYSHVPQYCHVQSIPYPSESSIHNDMCRRMRCKLGPTRAREDDDELSIDDTDEEQEPIVADADAVDGSQDNAVASIVDPQETEATQNLSLEDATSPRRGTLRSVIHYSIGVITTMFEKADVNNLPRCKTTL